MKVIPPESVAIRRPLPVSVPFLPWELRLLLAAYYYSYSFEVVAGADEGEFLIRLTSGSDVLGTYEFYPRWFAGINDRALEWFFHDPSVVMQLSFLNIIHHADDGGAYYRRRFTHDEVDVTRTHHPVLRHMIKRVDTHLPSSCYPRIRDLLLRMDGLWRLLRGLPLGG